MNKNKDNENLIFYTAPVIPYNLGISITTESVAAGFPSPAENYIEGELDLNRHLIKNPPATFFVRVSGDSMIDSGIHPNDILIVDRSIEVKSNDIIIAVIDNEFTVKRFIKNKQSVILQPENRLFKPIIIDENMDFEVWGVVTNVIHSVH